MAAKSWATSAATRTSMLGNKRTGTKPEIALRSALHAAGLRFRKDYRLDVDGAKPRPDVVFTRAKIAVFVDGCYWHSCPQHRTTPTRNADYWIPKLARNVQRDREHDKALGEAGWTVVRIWEHVPVAEATAEIVSMLKAVPSSRMTR